MKRTLALGVLATTLLVPVAGCAGTATETTGPAGNAPASVSQSPTPKPAELLAAATAKLDGQNLKFSLDSGNEPITGGLDAASGRFTISMISEGSKMEAVVAGNDLYLSTADLKGKWAHMAVAKLKSESSMLLLADPLFGRKLLAAATEVKQGAPGNFTGTIDLTKVTAEAGSPAKRLTDNFAKLAADKATAVAFTATVDAEGRLNTFQATFPGADSGKDLSYDFKITEVSTPVAVQVPPKSKVVEAPASSYNA
jgi:hypothetical protein